MGKKIGLQTEAQTHKKTSKKRFKATLPIIVYLLLVILFRILGQWYSGNLKNNNLKSETKSSYSYNSTKKPENEKSEFQITGQNLKTRKLDKKKYTKTEDKIKHVKKDRIESTTSKIPAYKKLNIQTQSVHSKSKKSFLHININIADSIELMKISGIGPKYARRIVKYRNKLGGYINIKQLKEIYGMSEENFSKIEKQLFISKGYKPKKIPLRNCTFKQLLSHPYCDYNTTKLLINERDKITKKKNDKTLKENILSREFLQKISKNDSTKLIKLLPYLELS